jgi:hypothetical protein
MRVSPSPEAAQLVDAPDDGGLLRVDGARDVQALALGRGDDVVGVPVGAAASDVPGTRLAHHRVVRALAGALPLHLGGEVGEAEHHLVHRVVERPLAVVQIEEHAHAGVGDLLEHVGGLDLLAAQARLLGHDQHVERRAGAECVEQAGEARPLGAEQRARDAVVGVDVRVGDGPALLRGIGARARSGA